MATTNTNSMQVDSDSKSNCCFKLVTHNDSRITAPGIKDPMFIHLSRTSTIRELVLLKSVSKTISDLVATHSATIARVRGEDNTMDWYFPLYVHTHEPIAPPDDHLSDYGMEIECIDREWIDPGSEWTEPEYTWSLSGVHRPSGKVHRLPSLSHLLPGGTDFDPEVLYASQGGLMLVLLENTLKPRLRDIEEVPPSPSYESDDGNWKPLIVTNPVTREWRLLPEPNCQDLGLWKWNYIDNFHLSMIVDKSANAYKVILIHRESLCVYKSTTNSWSSHIFSERIPFGGGYSSEDDEIVLYEGSVVVVNGRLHYVELEDDVDALTTNAVRNSSNLLEWGLLRTYEVDDEAGTWKQSCDYKLRNYIPSDLHRNHIDFGFSRGSADIGIVKCIGSIYAIIPAYLDIEKITEKFRLILDFLGTEVKYDECNFLKLRFHILRLEGSVGRPFGQLLIQNLGGVPFYANIGDDNILDVHRRSVTQGWYRCTARGSVIWVALQDYVLQYDVLSGRSTTERFENEKNRFTCSQGAFEPSLHMKP